MSFRRYLPHFALCVLAVASTLQATAQTEQPLTWAQDIAYMQKLTPAEAAAHQSTIFQIRSEVQLWINAHPNSGLQLSQPPAQPLSTDLAAAQLAELEKTVAKIVELDPSHPFHLGRTEVEVSTTLTSVSPTVDTSTQADIQLHNSVNATKAIDMLPGVEISQSIGKRNESVFNIRGFSSQGRVPLYLDGIPITVPYDGDVDLNRFLSSDISEIQVTRGYSSPLLGNGALGGSVNIVTKEPTRKYEGETSIGAASGEGLLSSVRLATRKTHYFVQGTLDWLQADYIPLSGNFTYPSYTTTTGTVVEGYRGLQDSTFKPSSGTGYTTGNTQYPLTYHMNHSDSRDEKWSGRIGWLPKGDDEYVFSYINQKGQKDVPLYMGSNASYTGYNSFWNWPYWNKNSYYFLSNTGLGEKSSVKARVYYDQFRNSINMWDNDQYSTMTSYTAKKGSGSEVSQYDEHADGASADFGTRLLKRNIIGASFYFKDDTHKETNTYPGATAYTTATDKTAVYNPIKALRVQQTSIGLQDQIAFSDRLHATLGFSADHINGLKENTYNVTYTKNSGGTVTGVAYALVPFTCSSSPTNTSYSGCMLHAWTFNPQASITYTLTNSDIAYVTYEDRGDFPTMKQMYSSFMAQGLPNPDLKSEHSQNWNIGYSHAYGTKLSFDGELYYSRLRNAIQSEYVTDTNSQCSNSKYSGYCMEYLNIGKEVHEGVEATVRSRPVTPLSLSANYSYLNRTLEATNIPADIYATYLNSNLYLPFGLPKHKALGTAEVQLPYNIVGVAAARYEGGITLQSDQYVSYRQAFATADLSVKIPVRSHFSTQFGVKNILDRNYFLTDGFPEEGRNWFLNARYRF
jgi:iron complex outermembrane recepter protein